MNDWINQLHSLLLNQSFLNETSVVMVSVARTHGSTPREVGAKLFVTSNGVVGTIGGGNLEYQASQIATDLLQDDQNKGSVMKNFSLSAGLGMCCGGTVDLIFERLSQKNTCWLAKAKKACNASQNLILMSEFYNNKVDKTVMAKEDLLLESCELPQAVKAAALKVLQDTKQQAKLLQWQENKVFYIEPLGQAKNTLYLFGAGHVGQAIVNLMQNLNWNIHWIDTREQCLEAQLLADKVANTSLYLTDSPEAEIALAKQGSYYLVMTHDHALDLNLCEHILKRDDYDYFGVIGSKTKRKRFEHRLLAKGYQQKILNKMICPIGINGIKSKHATSIAVSVVAQLLQQSEISIDQNTHQLMA